MAAGRLVGWLGWAGLDSVLRLGLLTGSTAIFSRLLEARDFGVAAIVLIAVAFAAVFSGVPFEEALAQRPSLRRQHVETALATSHITAAIMLAAALPVGFGVGAMLDAPEIAYLLPVAMTSLFFSAYADIIRGLARRHRRFKDMAIASVFAHVAGIGIAVVMAVAGMGVWALIAQRVLVLVVQALVLGVRAGFYIFPRFSMPHLKDLRRYAGLQLADRLSENLSYLLFNYLTAALYGLTVLGLVNMGFRLVEPIRGAIVQNVHNLIFYYFKTSAMASADGEKQTAVLNVMRRSALAGAPVFVGLAAVMSLLLPLLAGPGWDQSIGIAVCFAVGSAILLPARMVLTALSAGGRPEFSLTASILGIVATIGVLFLGTLLGPIGIGLARLAGDMVQAVLAVLLPTSIVGASRGLRIAALVPGWAWSTVMGGVVFGFVAATSSINPWIALVAAVLLGVATYAAALFVFERGFLRELTGAFLPNTAVKSLA